MSEECQGLPRYGDRGYRLMFIPLIHEAEHFGM